MNTRLLTLMTAAIAVALPMTALAEPPDQSSASAWIQAREKAIQQADGEKAALLRKELGDYYASRDDYAGAAEQYLQVISLGPSLFSPAERFQMAVRLSWANRFDEAVRALRQLLDEDPRNRHYRTHLAKVLSWSNHPAEAMEEADRVLRDHPNDQDALLVKANALRWQGKAAQSVEYYRNALAQGENFDARLGLAYACLETGDESAARQNSGMLTPDHPRQEQELRQFNDALCAAGARRPGVQFSRYDDSDRNRVNRSSLFYGFKAADWDSEVRYSSIHAVDPTRRTNAQDLSLKTSRRHDALTTSAGAGVTGTEDGVHRLTGHLRLDLDLGRGTAGVAAAREALTDTAQLIENGITRSMAAIALSQRAAQHLTFFENYARFGYSDGNAADDLRLAATYAVRTVNPKIDAGYRFRYWDFRRQSGSGYFDPEDFTSHQLFISLAAERNGFYVFAEPYAGVETFTRYTATGNETVYGYFASAGWRAKRCTAFELFSEGGNYAGATAAGFTYYLVGFRLNVFR